MIRALGSLLFYGRFLRSFSALGFRHRSAQWDAFDPDFAGQAWLIIDVVPGSGGMFSLDNGTGRRFLVRSKLCPPPAA